MSSALTCIYICILILQCEQGDQIFICQKMPVIPNGLVSSSLGSVLKHSVNTKNCRHQHAAPQRTPDIAGGRCNQRSLP